MDRLDAMRAFVMVARSGSFSAAADKLEKSPQLISKYVSQLEAHLSTRLLNRTTRKVHLTEAGQQYLPRASQVLDEIDAMENQLGDLQHKAHGLLRISAPVAFSTRHLAPLISQFQQHYPDVDVDSTEIEARYLGLTAKTELTVLDTISGNDTEYLDDVLPDDWQLQYFSANTSLSAPFRDPDDDGLSNLWEWAMNSDPSSRDSGREVKPQPRVMTDPDGVVGKFSGIKFSHRHQPGGIRYVVEESVDGVNWTPAIEVPDSSATPDNAGMIDAIYRSATTFSGGTKAYFRIRVEETGE